MALWRELHAHRLGLLWGSVQCHRTLASLQRDLPKPAKQPPTSKKPSVEEVWREFFSDPSQWWDHRSEKRNARFPDFVHKKTKRALWLNGKSNPSWVEASLEGLPSGSVQINIFTWNTRLTRLVKARKYEKTLELFQRMKREGVKPDKFTFVPVLSACAGLRALEDGKRIHTQIRESGFEVDVYVGSSLIGMYAKCGLIDDALLVFNKMPLRTVVSWNIMMLGYVKCGQGQKALELFQQMQQEGLEPVNSTFVAGLNACASVGALEEGKKIHEEVTRRGLQSDAFVNSSLIDMYAKCCSIDHAESVFNERHRPDVVSWSAMIQGFVKCGQVEKALELSRRMQRHRVEPAPSTFVGLLNACAKLGALEEGKRIHEWIIQKGCESDIFVGSSLVDMYAKCGSIEDAWRVFSSMSARDVVSWTAMIQGFVKSGQGRRALDLYQQMKSDKVEPHPITFVGILNACASVGDLEEGMCIHREVVRRGLEGNIFVSSSLVDMYTKCGIVENARRVFDKMSTRDVVAWNAMILGYVKCGQGHESLELSRRMHLEGVEPDPVTFVGLLNACASIGSLEDGRQVHKQILEKGFESESFVVSSLVDMYAKCGSMEDAWRVFKTMSSSSTVSLNAMIQGYVKCGQGQKGLELFRDMEMKGMELDPITFVGVLKACASVAALAEGRRLHQGIMERGYDSDVFVCNSLVDMYAKCGSLEDAVRVFNRMPIRNMISWNAMLGGYAIHGQTEEALRHFSRMCQEGVQMDTVTFVSLLSACTHAGLVHEGLHHFQSLSPLYGISATVEHYGCLVDLLGQSGRLHEAEELILKMSCGPDASVWVSLLGACRLHGNVEMGEQVAKRILELDPGNAGAYVLLSNIYAAAGRWASSAQVNRQRLESGVKKQFGQTWIEVDSKVHSFSTDGQDHPQMDAIYAYLKKLSVYMEELGYVPDTRTTSDVVEETENVSVMHHHCEKLAIAFGLIRTPSRTPIRVFKNQRISLDSHLEIKLMSKIVGRSIIVRDASRFHHFEEGSCSCVDCW